MLQPKKYREIRLSFQSFGLLLSHLTVIMLPARSVIHFRTAAQSRLMPLVR
jgi:hypothetical protein